MAGFPVSMTQPSPTIRQRRRVRLGLSHCHYSHSSRNFHLETGPCSIDHYLLLVTIVLHGSVIRLSPHTMPYAMPRTLCNLGGREKTPKTGALDIYLLEGTLPNPHKQSPTSKKGCKIKTSVSFVFKKDILYG
uniref:ARAD1C12100p n=1 Tax=Blastobotrys adeninivorans TaxID=409370 RepID=A0A060T0Y4_BLAAD